MQRPTQGQQNVSVDLSAAHDVVCLNCKADTFRKATKIKYLSAIASPTGQEILVPVEVFVCDKYNEELEPEKAIAAAIANIPKEPVIDGNNDTKGSVISIS